MSKRQRTCHRRGATADISPAFQGRDRMVFDLRRRRATIDSFSQSSLRDDKSAC